MDQGEVENMRRKDTVLNQLPETFTDRDTRSLPYLNQAIKETLRLYTAFPDALLRTVPEESHSPGRIQPPWRGNDITQAYSMHRDPRVFPHPLNLTRNDGLRLASRWKTRRYPLGVGSRSCLGIHLSRMELRLATAVFFRDFPFSKDVDS
ncbi:uncharacterized protein An04g06860, partial [Aspergillus niger]|uniref:Contig An04c0190, genomic contig n=2 Tax=Aspergillus niger TaxID=5061 RepID=A2QJF1_ASPNC